VVLSPNGHEQVIARGAKPCPGGEICFERLTGRWLQGNQPLLAELAVADDQAILDQIVALQSEGLGNPETCRRQQAEQIMVRVWADRVLGRNVQRRGHDRPDLFRFDDGRGRAWPLAPAEDTGRRNLVNWIIGLDKAAEVANGVEPTAGHICELAVWHQS
jgi:hypothetical protein